MSSKVMDVISGIQSAAPIRKVHPNPRDRRMYGRPGVTIGQHLDEFVGFQDNHGRSFDQLTFSTLHGGAKAPMVLPPKPQAGEVGSPPGKKALMSPLDAGKVAPSQEKVDIDAYMDKLKFGHLDEVRKRMVKGPNPERKRKQRMRRRRRTRSRRPTLPTRPPRPRSSSTPSGRNLDSDLGLRLEVSGAIQTRSLYGSSVIFPTL
jgi:hypothetical protein